jgi:hypothetical protein
VKFKNDPGFVRGLVENQSDFPQGLERSGTPIDPDWFDRVFDDGIIILDYAARIGVKQVNYMI